VQGPSDSTECEAGSEDCWLSDEELETMRATVREQKVSLAKKPVSAAKQAAAMAAAPEESPVPAQATEPAKPASPASMAMPIAALAQEANQQTAE
jgi:cell division septation protein DedD